MNISKRGLGGRGARGEYAYEFEGFEEMRKEAQKFKVKLEGMEKASKESNVKLEVMGQESGEVKEKFTTMEKASEELNAKQQEITKE
ncbi:hypothetical protein B9Z19DRAFT_1136902 [Tuber borchii]|uniref:Uncharacterized protein n=1 Tax=Tuber borchii TaxID=42251 RepID=A0A2T6ZB95_TUBBO|nr:hypothetical protein B9Z19DRAFT_1136902 [Tuber borchii]